MDLPQRECNKFRQKGIKEKRVQDAGANDNKSINNNGSKHS
jgi:hypothetical protein